jgi:hypothetical protein
MSIPDRFIHIAKGWVDKATQRWDELDAQAQQELDSRANQPTPPAWDRAKAKIDAGLARAAANNAATPQTTPIAPIQSPAAATTVDAAYRVLGLAPGSDYPSVQATYRKLIARVDPAKFAEGTPDQTKARDIERRINAAYMTLTDALAPTDDRFDRLEL